MNDLRNEGTEAVSRDRLEDSSQWPDASSWLMVELKSVPLFLPSPNCKVIEICLLLFLPSPDCKVIETRFPYIDIKCI